ncbi:IS256 family transposase [Rickettsiales bacterium]|mgnify:CR=1 FL=1|jgi:putative transposase|nr:IS256 family transposase [Rickettsiales bacterium]
MNHKLKSLNNSNNQNLEENFDYQKFKKEAIDKLYAGKGFSGKDGIFTCMLKDFLETAMQSELDNHLSSKQEDDVANRRNGFSSKIVKTDRGQFELNTPRDRNSSFDPKIVQKGQTILTPELDDKIITLYSYGMSYRDISSHIEEIYDIEISKSTITAITDKILPKITEFKERQLEEVYPIIFLDAMFFKVKENGKIISKAFYSALGVDKDGKKDILGIYLQESEGANFWLNILTDLQNRGVKDILIACVDGLKGFPEAINSIFPKTEIQLCIIHQIRNSIKYVASKNQKEFISDLKTVYTATSKEIAEEKLLLIEEKWGKKYPIIFKSWNNNWDNLSNYFKYPKEIRRLIYTTNSVEGFHRQVRKITKTKGSFPSDQSLEKLLYLAIQNIKKKWTMPIPNWSLIISQFAIKFEDRIKLDLA